MGNKPNVDDANTAYGVTQYTAAPTQVTISGASARNSSALAAGHYLIRATSGTHIKQGTVAITATTNDFILGAGAVYPMSVTVAATDGYLAGIQVSTGGTLQIMKVG